MVRSVRGKFLVALATLILIAAACGDDDDSPIATQTTLATTAASDSPTTVGAVDTTAVTDAATTSTGASPATTGVTTAATTKATTAATKPVTVATTKTATTKKAATNTTTKATTASTTPEATPTTVGVTPVGESKTVDEFIRNMRAIETQAFKLLDPVPKVEGTTNRGVTDSKIRIASVSAGTFNGAAFFPGMCEGAMARIDRANREGGVGNTRKRFLEWVNTQSEGYNNTNCMNDTGDRNLNRNLLIDAIENRQAFAIVNGTSPGFFADDYLASQHTPYFLWGITSPTCGTDKPYGFSWTGAIGCDVVKDNFLFDDRLFSFIARAGIPGITKPSDIRMSLVAADQATAVTAVNTLKKAAVATGVTMLWAEANYPVPPSPSPTDISFWINNLRANDPNVIVIYSSQMVVPIARGVRTAGYTKEIVNVTTSDERAIFLTPATLTALDGSVAIQSSVGTYKAGGPAFDQIRTDLDNIGFNRVLINSNTLLGYGAADFFIEALKATPEPLTTERLTNTVNDGFSYRGFGNALCPMIWPLGHVGQTPCGSALRIDSKGTNDLARTGQNVPGGLVPVVPFDYANYALIPK